MLTVVVILVVSGALLLGIAWGIYGRLPKAMEGFIVALAGGALIISVVLELVKPATEQTSIWPAFALMLVGAAVFITQFICCNSRLSAARFSRWVKLF